MINFKILHIDTHSSARQGILITAHGKVETPAFLPVGTAGAVKGITPQQLRETGADIILANTYHLMLRPGVDVIEKLGGLHKFMAWNQPILTDSGGYQIFSLSFSHEDTKSRRNLKSKKNKYNEPSCLGALVARIDDDGVEFTSHIDGAKIYLDAETATKIQNRLSADIIMCFDQCTPFPAEEQQLKKAVERTISWAKRTKKAHDNSNQLLFAIVQGGINLQLRKYCASELVKLGFDGYAIGGLSVGEGHANMVKTVNHTMQFLPEELPRYLMGVGTPADIITAVKAGVDMFDCVLPTRNGRNALAFTENGPVRLRNNAHIEDSRPIEADCDCYCCKNFSRATLRHFFNCREMLGPILTCLHNLRFYQRLMATIRLSLKKNEFSAWADEQLKNDY